MAVHIQLPEDIERHLRAQWGDLPRHTLESIALEAYRSRILTRSQVQRMLGLERPADVDDLEERAGRKESLASLGRLARDVYEAGLYDRTDVIPEGGSDA